MFIHLRKVDIKKVLIKNLKLEKKKKGHCKTHQGKHYIGCSSKEELLRKQPRTVYENQRMRTKDRLRKANTH